MTYNELMDISSVETRGLSGSSGLGSLDPISLGVNILSIGGKILGNKPNPTTAQIEQVEDYSRQLKNAATEVEQELRVLEKIAEITVPQTPFKLRDLKIKTLEKALSKNELWKKMDGPWAVFRGKYYDAAVVISKEYQAQLDEYIKAAQKVEADIKIKQIEQQKSQAAAAKKIAEAQQKQIIAQQQAAQINNYKPVSVSGSGGNILTAGSNNKIFIGVLGLLAAGTLIWGVMPDNSETKKFPLNPIRGGGKSESIEVK
ncbi:hypothetical protein N7E81_11600 [Reichenbachiella carrageenanivorans]|uniref:Uncharacterized protein n=1 Tax=Reichenbachiella carrageenanivorans TaxID=2979869 RepID=A0ABY6D2D6_9BACT|nr:hypothetical protein [Reichenbachiella carrageenanivorans]UXX78005.1 hypothetical protein N7E81_11600 [Reichenbachiella carrageenanivorans]